MAQLTPTAHRAARPLASAHDQRTAEHSSSSQAQAFTGQLDQALAEAAGSGPSPAPAPTGSVPSAAGPAAKPDAPPAAPLPAQAPKPEGTAQQTSSAPSAAAPGATDKPKPDAQSREGSEPVAQSASAVDPALAQAALVPPLAPVAATPNATAETANDALGPGEQAQPSPAGDRLAAALPGIGVAGAPHLRQARAAVAGQPSSTPLAGTGEGAAEAAGSAVAPTPEQTGASRTSPAGPAPADFGAATLTGRTSALPARDGRTELGISGPAAAASREAGTPPSGAAPASAAPSPESKPGPSSPAGPETLPVPSASTSVAAALTAHSAVAPAPSTPPPSTDPSAAAPAPPAAQIAAAVISPVQVTLATPPQAAGGAQTLTIHLKPAELGRVEIRIERTADGPAKIELAVQRPDTLLRLLRDQSQLQQALDQAGISPVGRTVQFSLAPDPSAGSAFGANTSGDGAPGGGGQRFQHGYSGHAPRDPDEASIPVPSTAWARTGLNITA